MPSADFLCRDRRLNFAQLDAKNRLVIFSKQTERAVVGTVKSKKTPRKAETGSFPTSVLILPIGSERKLVPVFPSDPERGIVGTEKTYKRKPREFDDFEKRLSETFTTYYGLVFPHR